MVWAPNSVVPTYGGDGFIIHYNMAFHVAHDHSVQLRSMYYPEGELIFMTAANGMISTIMRWINQVLPCQYAVVGVANFVLVWGVALTAFLLFLCLRYLKVKPLMALPFSVIIALLSPQITRMLCGHYSTAVSFYIPVLLVIIFKYWDKSLPIYTLISVVLFQLFFGFNDPYVLAIGAAMLLSIIFVKIVYGCLSRAKFDWKNIISLMLITFIPLIVLFITLGYFDTVNDRVKVPASYFENLSTVAGVLCPEGSLGWPMVSDLLNIVKPKFEGIAYVGFIPAVLLIGIMLTSPLKKYNLGSKFWIVFFSGFICLLYSFGFPLGWFKEWSIDNLEKVMQLRAPGRFAWVFYYIWTLLAVVCISRIYSYLKDRSRNIAAHLMIILILCVWGFEAHTYLNAKSQGILNTNPISQSSLSEYNQIVEDIDINPDEYAGLYMLPVMQGWTDKILHEGNWSTYFYTYKIAIASGVGITNGNLSRMSVSKSLDVLQLVSDSLIKKDYWIKNYRDKKLLLVVGDDVKLHESESKLLRYSELVLNHSNFNLYSLELNRLLAAEEIIRKEKIDKKCSSITDALYYNPCEDDNPVSFVGSGSKRLDPGWHEVMELDVPMNVRGDTLELSFWNYVDNERGGLPFWILQQFQEDQKLMEQKLWSLRARDTQNGWVKITFDCIPWYTTDKIRLYSEYGFHSYIDEILVRRKDTDICNRQDDIQIVNNIILKDE